jgi:protease-4
MDPDLPTYEAEATDPQVAAAASAIPHAAPKPERSSKKGLSRSTRLLLFITLFGMLLACASGGAVLLLLLDEGPSLSLSSNDGWLRVLLRGNIPDGPTESAIYFDESRIPLTVGDYVAALQVAASDESVPGVFLDLDDPHLGLAAASEIRRALLTLRDAGKPCHAWSKTYSNATWYLATACEKIVMHPEGVPFVVGLQVATEHYAGLLEKVGVEADYVKVGTYKSAPEAYELTGPSESSKLMLESLLDSLHDNLIAEVAESREMETSAVQALIDDPPVTGPTALARGLVDELYSRQAWIEIHYDDDLQGMRRYVRKMRRDWKSSGDTIAVLHLQGTIVDGSSESGAFGGQSVGDRSIVRHLERLRDDDDIKAVVLRINSPGGSALASDVMWEAIRRLDLEKPVVASMGAMAASGGYYVAMPARVIYANPATLTGSIGVFGGKFAVQGLYEKLGISTWSAQRGPLAGIYSSPGPFTDLERAKILERIEAFYRTFVTKAAEGRNMTFEELDSVAQGRVWTGTQALEVGLVDHIGGLEDAIAAAADLAGLEADSYGRLVLPKEKSFVEVLFESPNDEERAHATLLVGLLGEKTVQALLQARQLDRILRREGVVAALPYRLEVW